ncbi:MAG: hypothetical protein QG602_596, partial [Verrucomicrobiota bacterium]|nr:hypothetical protein [Verrucomicrobiota bacterium]
MISADLVLVMAVTGFLVGILGWWLHRRARSRVAEQADRRIRQMSELIDRAQCALWEADVTLETNDWEWRLRLHPSEFSRHLFGETVDGNNEHIWRHFQIDTHGQMDRRAREAMERGHPGYQQEFRAVRDGRTYWLHENVTINRTGPDNFRLVGLITDLTAQREAETARRQSELVRESILAQAQCMIWRATVEDRDGVLQWPHFDVPRSRLSELLFGSQRTFTEERGFWDELETPDQKQMDEHSTKAIRDNAPGYEQQFRVITKAGRTFHLHELVSITRLGTGSWSLVGVVTDITAQTEAEEAQKRTQTTLEHLLERADCLLWQATVELRPEEVEWDISCYQTAFTRRIFGEVPPPTQVGLWYRFEVPERPEMDRRAREALENKRPGYEQQFRLIKEGQTLWVDERVSVTPTGPNRFWLVGLATDITVRREAEEAFRESQERLRGLLDGAECMVWDATVQKRPDGTL